jgi:hypothetical protein
LFQFILKGGNNEDTVEGVVCSPNLLSEYLFLPDNPVDRNLTIAGISNALCNMNRDNFTSFWIMTLEELNINPVLENWLNISLEQILLKANVSQSEGEEALRDFGEGMHALFNVYRGNLESLAEAFKGSFEENFTPVMYAGQGRLNSTHFGKANKFL